MEDMKGNIDKKRTREDGSAVDSAGSKLTRAELDLELDSDSTQSDTSSSISFVNSDPEHNSSESKRPRVNSPELTHSESPNFQADLLGILDDPEAERDQAIMGLDSVIKSFEEEILFPATLTGNPPPSSQQPELGYLLEASDDELGLPPAPDTVVGEGKIEAAEFVTPDTVAGRDMFELGLGFEDELPSFGDSFEFGVSGDGSSEYVAFGGLFDCTEGDLWRAEESMRAV